MDTLFFFYNIIIINILKMKKEMFLSLNVKYFKIDVISRKTSDPINFLHIHKKNIVFRVFIILYVVA